MKKKKTKNKKQKDVKPSFPKKLNLEQFFASPIWYAEEPSFVDSLNKASDPYIEASKKRLKPTIGDPNFAELQNYIGATSHNLLEEMGFDMSGHKLFMTEMWVQEFAKKGGGHHTLHTHWNGHMSGFYFLKASEATSMPMFEDPRPGNIMNLLPEKDKTKVTYASSQINYKASPGRMIFFPSYLPHQYIVDMGYEPFRFIHWNCQAIPKGVLNVI